MPSARNRFERAEQALRWCERNWPCGRPVDLLIVDEIIDHDTGEVDPDGLGQTYRDGRRIVIELKRIGCRGCLMATLWHEFAHAHLWGHAGAEFDVAHHPPHLYTLIGEIETLWGEIGWEEASEYDVR